MFLEVFLVALMGMLPGASTHRAGLCTIKGVAGLDADLSARPLLLTGVTGGVIFGVGAAFYGA